MTGALNCVPRTTNQCLNPAPAGETPGAVAPGSSLAQPPRLDPRQSGSRWSTHSLSLFCHSAFQITFIKVTYF